MVPFFLAWESSLSRSSEHSSVLLCTLLYKGTSPQKKSCKHKWHHLPSLQFAKPSFSQDSLPRATGAGSQPILRTSNPRIHSHSLSVGSINTHRVSRRKSTSASNASGAAVSAALQAVEHSPDASTGPAGKKPGKAQTKAALAASLPTSSGFEAQFGGLSLPKSPTGIQEDREEDDYSAADGKPASKVRMRRASEGTPRLFQGGRRPAGSELKCEVCGKAYKHSSCLHKHKLVHPWPLPRAGDVGHVV
jgi:hypothetical protein